MPCLDEQTATFYVQRQLHAARALEVDCHLDVCASCRRLVADVALYAITAASSLTDSEMESVPGRAGGAQLVVESALRRGARLGRYILLEVVGVGAMGIVFSAYDPDLERKVALKVVHGVMTGAEAHRRLASEARAMAKLSHPNVVVVHEAGLVGDQAFIAMELVEGTSLRKRLAQADANFKTVMGWLLQAGRGLAAAHSVGIVHRDFKPDNVLVGRDGRARVTDFGLALTGGAESTARGPHSEGSRRIGTPAYMSPEQQRGEPVDALSDQFSFCVTAYEALAGVRPPVMAARNEAAQSRDDAPPARNRVRSAVWRILARGMAPQPQDRFVSMQALLEDLEPYVERRFARRAAVGVLVGVLALAAWAVWTRPEPAADCWQQYRSARLWSQSDGETLRAAFVATRVPSAADVAASVDTLFRSHAESWKLAYRATCERLSDADEREQAMLLQARRCLQGRLVSLNAQRELFAQADGQIVGTALQMTSGLLPPSDCVSEATSTSASANAVAPAEEAAAGDLAIRLGRIAALSEAGKAAEALSLARQAESDVTARGDALLTARLLCAKGNAERLLGMVAESLDTLRRCALKAEAARDDELAAQGYLELARVACGLARDIPRAEDALEHADASVARTPSQLLRGQLLSRRASVESLCRNDLKAARLRQEQALAVLERSMGADHPITARAYTALAGTLVAQGEGRQALPLAERAAEVMNHWYGATHTDTISALYMTAAVHMVLAHFETALEIHEQILAVEKADYGDTHPLVGWTEAAKGDVLYWAARYEEARDVLQEALRTLTAAHGAENLKVVEPSIALGRTLWRLGRFAESEALLMQAIETANKVSSGHPLATVARFWLAHTQLSAGEPQRALATIAPVEAVWLQRANSPNDAARRRFLLARVRWEAGLDRRARFAEALDALDELREGITSEPLYRGELEEAERWVAARQAP